MKALHSTPKFKPAAFEAVELKSNCLFSHSFYIVYLIHFQVCIKLLVLFIQKSYSGIFPQNEFLIFQLKQMRAGNDMILHPMKTVCFLLMLMMILELAMIDYITLCLKTMISITCLNCFLFILLDDDILHLDIRETQQIMHFFDRISKTFSH